MAERDEIDLIIEAAIAEGRSVRQALDDAGYDIEYVGEPTTLEDAAAAGFYMAAALLEIRGKGKAIPGDYRNSPPLKRYEPISFAEPGSPEHESRRAALREKK